MNFDAILELIGIVIIILTNIVLFVSKFQKHETKLVSIEKRLDALTIANDKLTENSRTLHNIEGQLKMMIQYSLKAEK